jgi:hypothetical protein
MANGSSEKYCVPFTKLPNKLLLVTATIADITIMSILDTGASCNYMDSRLWDAIHANEPDKIVLQAATARDVQSSTGHRQTVKGSFSWQIQLGNYKQVALFNVVENQPVPLLIGGDLFEPHNAIIDYGAATLTLHPPEILPLDAQLLTAASASLYAGTHLRCQLNVACS